MFEGKKIIIFDMDGTLIDSVGIWNHIDKELISSFGKNPPEEKIIQKMRDEILDHSHKSQNPYLEYCSYLNMTYGSIYIDAEKIIKIRYDIAHRFLKYKIDYKPFAELFIKELAMREYVLVIASTTKKSNMDIYRTENANIISKAPIDKYFLKVYTREDVKSIKPDPEVYLKVMEDLEAKAGECLVFEDSLVGIKAAKAAGIDVVAVYDVYSDDARKEINKMADYTVKGYKEVIEILKKERPS